MGIAIGDVSGKGVPAAIYMTLTKGILQTCASDSNSPKQVLNKLNKQIYTNIERNSFVSMFYAVIDMKKRRLRFSRAGTIRQLLYIEARNRMRCWNPKGWLSDSKGVTNSMRLSRRMKFRSKEVTFSLFYTAGFTEASTKDGDEFGRIGFSMLSQGAKILPQMR